MDFSVLQQTGLSIATPFKERCQVFHQMGWVKKQLFMPVYSIVNILLFAFIREIMHMP